MRGDTVQIRSRAFKHLLALVERQGRGAILNVSGCRLAAVAHAVDHGQGDAAHGHADKSGHAAPWLVAARKSR